MDNSKVIYINILLIVLCAGFFASISNNQRYHTFRDNAHLLNQGNRKNRLSGAAFSIS